MALYAPRYAFRLTAKNYIRDFASNFLSTPIDFTVQWMYGLVVGLKTRQNQTTRRTTCGRDPTRACRAGFDFLGPEAVSALIEALQTKDLDLRPLYQEILARIPSATPTLIKISPRRASHLARPRG